MLHVGNDRKIESVTHCPKPRLCKLFFFLSCLKNILDSLDQLSHKNFIRIIFYSNVKQEDPSPF